MVQTVVDVFLSTNRFKDGKSVGVMTAAKRVMQPAAPTFKKMGPGDLDKWVESKAPLIYVVEFLSYAQH